MERAPIAPNTDHRWTTDGPNILSEGVLERVRHAISQGWIGGLHYFYCGGRSGDSVAFRTFDAFLSQITDARPGDLFILWSVPEIRGNGLLLVDNQFQASPEANASMLTTDDLDRVREYLTEAEFNEILSISSAGNGNVEAVWTDLEGSGWDTFLDAAQRAAVPCGALCVLPLTKLDRPEFYLVKAKRPNAQGEVPLGGAY